MAFDLLRRGISQQWIANSFEPHSTWQASQASVWSRISIETLSAGLAQLSIVHIVNGFTPIGFQTATVGEKRGLRLNHLLLNETLHEKLKSASVDREERGKTLLSALDQKRSFSPGQSNDRFAPIADISIHMDRLPNAAL